LFKDMDGREWPGQDESGIRYQPPAASASKQKTANPGLPYVAKSASAGHIRNANHPSQEYPLSFLSPDLHERQKNAAAVKKAMLEKFRAKALDPALEQARLKRIAIAEARDARMAEREVARLAREAELAAQAARQAELAAKAQREKEELEALIAAEEAAKAEALAAEQKAARDARYAARKAAKKVRRRGY
jgi:hypothetical protein